MKIRSFYTLDNGSYKVTISTQDWSDGDKSLMLRFGEPEINLGGTFSGGGISFTLPSRYVKIMTNSPFFNSFDSKDYDNAEARANLWATTIASRISSAVITLRALVDSFSREEIQNV